MKGPQSAGRLDSLFVIRFNVHVHIGSHYSSRVVMSCGKGVEWAGGRGKRKKKQKRSTGRSIVAFEAIHFRAPKWRAFHLSGSVFDGTTREAAAATCGATSSPGVLCHSVEQPAPGIHTVSCRTSDCTVMRHHYPRTLLSPLNTPQFSGIPDHFAHTHTP